MAADIKDWSANDLENLMLDDINLSREQGGEVAKLMGAIKRKFDDVDLEIAGVAGAYTFKGTVDTVADLPESGNQVGDVYNVTSGTDGGNYAWDGAQWDRTGDSLVDVDGAQVLAKGSTTKRTLGERFADVVNVRDFGAAGDGVTDDVAAVQAALEAGAAKGRSVFFPSGTYKISESLILEDFTSKLSIIADNAKIILDASSAQKQALYLSPKANIFIKGLNIDAGKKAYCGLMIKKTDESAKADLHLENLIVENVYRSGTTYAIGDGIFSSGEFTNVKIINCAVKNCTMAQGAGVQGSQGIFGVTITRLENTGLQGKSSDNIYIENLYVENVYSEDETYINDQDGLRIFSNYRPDGGFNNPDSVFISGGFFKNIRGRAIKVQTHNATVDGITIVNTGAIGGYSGVLKQKSSIDLQTGFGNISNITWICKDVVCADLLRLGLDETQTFAVVGGNISNLRADIKIADQVPVEDPPSIQGVFAYIYPSLACNINILNINIESDYDFSYICTLNGAGNKNYMNVCNAVAPVSSGTARLLGSGYSHCGIVNITNIGQTAVPACVVTNNTRHTFSVENAAGAILNS